MPLTKRSRARILAMQALCVLDAVGNSFAEKLGPFLRDPVNYKDLGWDSKPSEELQRLARDLATGVWERRADYDAKLAEAVAGWSVDRMQPVDRNIIRLGLYEMLECPDTPVAVVMNEAIEMARRFGGKESPGFVNGVLDGLRKRMGIEATSRENGESTSPRE